MKVAAFFADSHTRHSDVKPSFTTDQAATQLLRGGFRHHDRNGDGKIDLSFTMDERFSTQQKVSIRMALQAWSDVTNIKFKENATGVDGSLNIIADPNTNDGLAGLPNEYYGDVTATIGTRNASNPRQGDNFSRVVIHELGHALGLDHPADYESATTYERSAYVQDTKANSVMSYWSETKQAAHDFKWNQPSVPMKDDIAAIQKLYGSNLQTRNTDTTYGFNSNTDRKHLSLNSPRDEPVFTVWDGGGNDTLDFSGFHQHQLINLNAEAFSDVGGLRGNVAIAKGVAVENGIGGAGNDVVIGNQMGNRIKGGGGADKLTGGGGEDVFVYDEVDESTLKWPDEILDFTSGTDKIDLSGVLKKANLNSLDVVERFTGRPGEIILSHNPSTGQGSLSLDVMGNGIADVFIKSHGAVRRGDVLTGGPSNPAVTNPELTPEPGPEAEVTPEPDEFNFDTVYGFNSNTCNPAMSLVPGSGAPRFTVKDSHGYDTLDFSGFKQAQRVDLRAGAASSVGGQLDNVVIDRNTTVESGIGGSGNDLMIGNSVNNDIIGGAGGDTLWGVGGANTFIYTAASDSHYDNPDMIMDFVSGRDRIDLRALKAEANVSLRLVDTYTGRIGDTVVKYNQQSDRFFVGVDLTGNRRTDFLVKSTRLVKPSDVVGLSVK